MGKATGSLEDDIRSQNQLLNHPSPTRLLSMHAPPPYLTPCFTLRSGALTKALYTCRP